MILWALVALTALLVASVLVTAKNLRDDEWLPRPRGDGPKDLKVSVLVPARNEERAIGPCLDSLARQSYPELEVVVLDDHSTDATRAIALEKTVAMKNARVVSGQDLPEGWVGKVWACHQLSEHATGDILVFLDADTTLAPWTIEAAVEERHRRGREFLTLLPRLLTNTFWVEAILPCAITLQASVIPTKLVRELEDENQAFANGQFILLTRRAYQAIGGHAAVRHSILEDIALAIRGKKAGHMPAVYICVDGMETLMYESFADIWQGFSKNLFAAMHESLPVAIVYTLGGLALFALPFALLAPALLGAFGSAGLALVLAQLACILAGRFLLWRAYRVVFWTALVKPLGVVLWMGILWSSVRQRLSRRGYLWKGRRYYSEKRAL